MYTVMHVVLLFFVEVRNVEPKKFGIQIAG
jgi:hypothetical protein